ncbi:hypothetical protein AKJ16_DCAP24821 [Drosera capensis]
MFEKLLEVLQPSPCKREFDALTAYRGQLSSVPDQPELGEKIGSISGSRSAAEAAFSSARNPSPLAEQPNPWISWTLGLEGTRKKTENTEFMGTVRLNQKPIRQHDPSDRAVLNEKVVVRRRKRRAPCFLQWGQCDGGDGGLRRGGGLGHWWNFEVKKADQASYQSFSHKGKDFPLYTQLFYSSILLSSSAAFCVSISVLSTGHFTATQQGEAKK